ncbi:MAG TPA: septation protein IspZ, partial [Stellaceae bacterium]|nr:septation protein IspZ [Stellaceae bacterium]
MAQAIRQLVEDFLSTILFFVVYAVTGNLYAAVGIAIATGLAQVARLIVLRRPVGPMQWTSLGLVVVLGSGSILLQSPRLMMMKPSVVHLAIAAVMLRRGWMSRYLPPIVRQHVGEQIIVAAGYAWAALLASLGIANFFIALNCDFATWAWFISVGAVGAKLVAFGVQYAIFRALTRRGVVSLDLA